MVTARVLEHLRKKVRRSNSFNGKGLVERLARDLACDRTDVRRALRELRQQGLLLCNDWAGTEPLSKVTLALPEEPSPCSRLWREVLSTAELTAADAAALTELGDALDGLDAAQMGRLLQGLIRLRGDLAHQSGRPRFEVSAEYLLGSSKLLDTLPSAPLRRFGIDGSRLPAFPGYVMVAGPVEQELVVLVENPHAFERALQAEGTGRAAWVCTFGYGLSLRQSQHGEQLATLQESRAVPRTLCREGSPPDWESLLRHQRILFWGDLDLEGLAIFHRLREHNPRIGLSGIYRPMLEQLQAGGGHPYCTLVGKVGQSIPRLGRELAPLVELCRQRALDQEWVTEQMILRWWSERLVIGRRSYGNDEVQAPARRAQILVRD